MSWRRKKSDDTLVSQGDQTTTPVDILPNPEVVTQELTD